MDIKEKQARWAIERPLFEAKFIHSHLLPFFNFNENTGDYEIKDECLNTDTSEDRRLAYETLNTGWVMWLRAKRDAKAQAVPEGFVLLPKIPSEKLIYEKLEQIFPCSFCHDGPDSWKRTYIKVIEAAQEPT